MRRFLAILALLTVLVLLASAVSPSAAQTSGGACPGAPLPRLLTPGTQARPAQVFSTLWASPNNTAIITVMLRAANDTFTTTSGPTCANGPYNWYQVNFKGVTGWVTEGTGNTYWIEPVSGSATAIPPTSTGTVTAVPPTPTQPVATIPPTPTRPPTTPVPNQGACPGAPAPRLIVNSNARPAQVFSSLRTGLDSADVITVMFRANNDVFHVIAGPYCGSGPHNWWQVDYKGTVGWVTEGEGSTYWVEPAPTPR
jgi:hypothetical protein